MKQFNFRILILLVIAFYSFSSYSQALHHGVLLKVVIIRHCEKPDSGSNCTCAGLNRALALPNVLDTVTGTPDYTYVPSLEMGKKTKHSRMFETVMPFAVQKNLDINSKFDEADTANVALELMKKRGVVLMVWEHSNIPPIARNLGVKSVPSWGKKDFDSIWIIEFSKTDKKGKLKNPVLTIEKENINPSGNCPGQ